MKHVLDNPVWNAMISGNRQLASGSDRARFFDLQVSPFAALLEPSTDNFHELARLCPPGRPVLLWSDREMSFEAPWLLKEMISGLQMVYEAQAVNEYPGDAIFPLTSRNIPQMLALTALTRPGPFGERTIEFGNYEGIFKGGQLVAMTGRRFHCFDHVEISAVCTHPAHLGKGYATQLLVSQLTQILSSGSRPYLHVREDNIRAIEVYQSLGFSIRMPVFFYVIRSDRIL